VNAAKLNSLSCLEGGIIPFWGQRVGLKRGLLLSKKGIREDTSLEWKKTELKCVKDDFKAS